MATAAAGFLRLFTAKSYISPIVQCAARTQQPCRGKRSKSLVCFSKARPRRMGTKKVSPLKRSIAREVRSIVTENKMVIVAHYNDLTADEWSDLRYSLNQQEIGVRVIPTKVARRALDQCAERTVSVLFRGPSLLLYSREASGLPPCLRALQGVPVEPLGGLVDQALLTREQMEGLARLPPLPEVQSGLASLLLGPAHALSQNLQHHQHQLAALLGRHIQDKQAA